MDDKQADGNSIIKDTDESDIKHALYEGKCTCEPECLQVRNIVIFGQTGAGKTTFIDSYTNFLLGVDFYDKFRYKLVDERGLIAQRVGESSEA